MTSNTQVFPRKVVAAATKCLFHWDVDQVVIGVRHFDKYMRQTMGLLQEKYGTRYDEEQGFVDQWGVFMSRTEAMQVVKASGQPFSFERNGHQDEELFSEGVW